MKAKKGDHRAKIANLLARWRAAKALGDSTAFSASDGMSCIGLHKTETIMKGKTQNQMKSKIINHIRAGYPGLYLVSPEEQRVEAEMHQVEKVSPIMLRC